MTINQHLENFLSDLTPSDAEKSSYSDHRQSIESKLATSFGVKYVFESGSFNNGTGIRYYTDLDLIASIPLTSQRSDSLNMLNAVKGALQERFPSSLIYIRTPAVVCQFAGQRKVEVTPGYYEEKVGDFLVYSIPGLDGEWRRSSPWAHNNYVTIINSRLAHKVKPLIRLFKALKYFRNIPISSFYLEIRVAKYCETEQSVLYDYDFRQILNRLIAGELAAARDPMGISGNISACSTENMKQEALSKLKSAQSRVANAFEAESAGRHTDALYWWKMVFDREI